MSSGAGIEDLVDHAVAPGNVLASDSGTDATAAPEPAHTLRVSVTWGNLTGVPADVHVVGHYEDVLPAAAEAALDTAISTGSRRSIIAEHTRRRWLVGRLGEVTYFPSAHDTVRIPAVAGLGRHGTFTSQRAVQLYTSLLTELAMLGQARTAATVLIGSGAGNLTVGQACRALVDGFAHALARLSGPPALTDVAVVEIDRLRAEEVLAALRREIDRRNGSGLQLQEPVEVGPGGTVSARAAAVYGALALARLAAERGGEAAGQNPLRAVLDGVDEPIRDLVETRLRRLADIDAGAVDHVLRSASGDIGGPDDEEGEVAKPVRISILSDESTVRWAALSDHASVAERRLAKSQVFDDLVARLTDPSTDDAGQLPEWLSRMIIPPDFHTLVSDRAPLVLEVDRATAAMHWEFLTDLDDRRDPQWPPLIVRTPICRQLRTGYSQVLIEPATPTSLRALVVGDPGAPQRASLAGAREEAKRVRTALRDLGVDVTAYIGAPTASRDEDLAGIAPATRLEVLGELLSGRYDLVHFSGHGTFDEDDPERRAGWVFADGLLTSRELAQLTEPPRVVVANACFTSVLSRTEDAAPAGGPPEATLTPGLADEFLRGGVVHYVGTAWPIHDAAGAAFALTFYRHLLGEGASIGRAVCASRNELWQRRDEWAFGWAAYQHYGDPTDCLQTRAGRAAPPRRDER